MHIVTGRRVFLSFFIFLILSFVNTCTNTDVLMYVRTITHTYNFLSMYSRQNELADEMEGPSPEVTRGLPRAHGIFYSAGIALICEGVFSACYHICPSFSNFQFDVAFMYMIAGEPPHPCSKR